MTESTAAAPPQAPPASVYTSRDPAPLARTVVVWLYIELGLQVAYLLATAATLQFLSSFPADLAVGWSGTLPGGEPYDLVTGLVSFAWLAAYLVAAFLSLKWIYRVNRNAHSMATGLTIRPPWAVGWFFVPVANLFMPFRAMRQSWQASVEPQAWRTVPVPGLLRWWWGLWLVSNFIGYYAMRITFAANSVSELRTVAIVDILSGFLSIPLSLIFIRIVRRLTDNQVQSLHRSAFD
jgi:hypothetical protein